MRRPQQAEGAPLHCSRQALVASVHVAHPRPAPRCHLPYCLASRWRSAARCRKSFGTSKASSKEGGGLPFVSFFYVLFVWCCSLGTYSVAV